MGEKKRSSAHRSVLDVAQRRIRLKRFLDSLDKNNMHEDITMSSVKLPSFDDKPAPKKRRKVMKKRFPKSFQALIEDGGTDAIRYTAALSPPSPLPHRNFCVVCGYTSGYKCLVCGAKYCSIKCHETHSETRCLKWT